MRVYVGERDPDDAKCRVWVVHEPPRPALSDVVDLIGELRSLSGILHVDDDPAAARARREDVLRRKEALIALLDSAEQSPPPAELISRVDRMDVYGWGGGPGSANLAFAILRAELGEDPPASVYGKFRLDVLDPIYDRWSFRLPADSVWSWVEDNRRLVEHELFEKLPPALPEEPDVPALAPPAVDADSPMTDEEPVSEAAASQVVRACEEAWVEIRRHHPELPDAVMVLGSGVERGRLVKLGHWWAGRWVADGQPRGEVLLAGEALHLKPEEVFEVLLHEAAHGLNAARGVKDTSREGRYHNARFGAAAREVGLRVAAMPPYGVARTSLTAEARERYRVPIERLADVMRIARQLERTVRVGTSAEQEQGADTEGGDEERRAKGRALAVCGCGRKLRVAPSVLSAGPIVCGLCEVEFSAGAERLPSAESKAVPGHVVDQTFVQRRRRELGAAATADAHEDRPEPERADLEELIPGAAKGLQLTERDLVAAGSWYERFGTYDEQPMRAEGQAEAMRRNELARALLRADGTVRGPSLDVEGMDLAAGDRVVVTGEGSSVGPPVGTLGTVDAVNLDDRAIDIDFATWGRIRAGVDDAVTRFLRHDYVAVADDVAAGTGGVEPPGRSVEAAWAEADV